MTGCGAPLRASVRSDVELEQGGPVPIEKVVAVRLDSGRCGEAGLATAPRFCSFACFARWHRDERKTRSKRRG